VRLCRIETIGAIFRSALSGTQFPSSTHPSTGAQNDCFSRSKILSSSGVLHCVIVDSKSSSQLLKDVPSSFLPFLHVNYSDLSFSSIG
jgi:hypothetical protein